MPYVQYIRVEDSGFQTIDLYEVSYNAKLLQFVQLMALHGEWRKLHNEELNGLYSLPNIVRVIKSRTLRWAGHVARMGEGEVCTGFWWGNLRERDRWGDPGVDGRIMLGWIFKELDVGVGTGLGWLRIGIRGGRL
jgi:hypothetical protein